MRCEQTRGKLISGVIQGERLELSSKIPPQAWISGMSKSFSVRYCSQPLNDCFYEHCFQLLRILYCIYCICALLPDGYGHGKQAETNIWPFRMMGAQAESRAVHWGRVKITRNTRQHQETEVRLTFRRGQAGNNEHVISCCPSANMRSEADGMSWHGSQVLLSGTDCQWCARFPISGE